MSRYINKRFILAFFLLVVLSFSLPAFDIWQYPLAADKGSIFAGVFAAAFAFDFNDPSESGFSFDYPEIYLDYILPVGLPFSIGASIDSFQTDQYGLGLRPGYHINFDVPNLDIYIMYSLNFDIYRNKMVLDHGIRLGLRYIFYDLICLNLETGYRFQSINFGLAVKLN